MLSHAIQQVASIYDPVARLLFAEARAFPRALPFYDDTIQIQMQILWVKDKPYCVTSSASVASASSSSSGATTPHALATPHARTPNLSECPEYLNSCPSFSSRPMATSATLLVPDR